MSHQILSAECVESFRGYWCGNAWELHMGLCVTSVWVHPLAEKLAESRSALSWLIHCCLRKRPQKNRRLSRHSWRVQGVWSRFTVPRWSAAGRCEHRPGWTQSRCAVAVLKSCSTSWILSDCPHLKFRLSAYKPKACTTLQRRQMNLEFQRNVPAV